MIVDLCVSLLRVLCCRQEYKEIRESKDGSGVSAELVGEDYTHWKVNTHTKAQRRETHTHACRQTGMRAHPHHVHR